MTFHDVETFSIFYIIREIQLQFPYGRYFYYDFYYGNSCN